VFYACERQEEDDKKVLFSSLSKSGGVIDIMRAYQYAKEYK
jgi:glucose-6-phosphate isomerase